MTELLINFSKIKISALKGDLNQFFNDVENSVKILDDAANESNTSIKYSNEIISGQKENVIITIYLSSSKLENNEGKKIVEFKKSIISVFEKYGVTLTLREILIKVVNFGEVMNNHLSENAFSINENNENELENEIITRAQHFTPVEPHYSFSRVIIDKQIKNKIDDALGILECEEKVFEEWGLIEIEPHPSSALNFFGNPGTGKTMAAEAVAEKFGKKILKVSYADVESKYHGEGPKILKSIFNIANKEQPVLFFDEADSLLSKRLSTVSQGSEQAINSMRSQLLIELDKFRGIVIFATNLIDNYDKAFLSRLINIEFIDPSEAMRKEIWNVHLWPVEDGKIHKLNIPLANDVDTSYLAKNYKFVGRDIKNAVISACVSAACNQRNIVTQSDLVNACDKINDEKKGLQRKKSVMGIVGDAIKSRRDKDSKKIETKKNDKDTKEFHKKENNMINN